MVIAAGELSGLFYGTRTALQLIQQAVNNQLPALTIIDAPVSKYRGLMIDNVRNPHNFSFHMEMIEKMSAVKMNVYQLHASDDQGYSLPSAAYPTLSTSKLALSTSEVAALQQKAKESHVNIVRLIHFFVETNHNINARSRGKPASHRWRKSIYLGIVQRY